MKKNESSQFEITFSHIDAQALAASLVTEVTSVKKIQSLFPSRQKVSLT